MESTVIRRTAQLIEDLQKLQILEKNDTVRVLFVNGLDMISVGITFEDKSVDEESPQYMLVKIAFEKEFEEKLNELVRTTESNVMKFLIWL